MKAPAPLGLVVAVSATLVGAILTPRLVTPTRLDRRAIVTRDTTMGDREEARDGAVDLYGNDVADAVAEYTLDAAGSVYERHSPRTELPRLTSPKS